MIWQAMNTRSGFNNFNIVRAQMKSFLFSILFTLCYLYGFAQNKDARTNALGGCGLTQSTVWSNFSNQAGLANIKNFTFGLGSENQFLLSELSRHTIACAIPVNGGVIGVNLNYFGFDLYNETKIGLAFGKKLSKSFNIGIQLDYLGTYVNEGADNLHNFTFEVGVQKQLSKELVLGAHIFNPIGVKLNEEENIPSVIELGLRYNANQKVSLFTEVSLESEQNGNLHLGLEYKIINELALRTGFSTNPAKISFGVGYTINNIQLDVAVKRHQLLGYSPQFSVSSAF